MNGNTDVGRTNRLRTKGLCWVHTYTSAVAYFKSAAGQHKQSVGRRGKSEAPCHVGECYYEAWRQVWLLFMCGLIQFVLRKWTQPIWKHNIHHTYYQNFKVWLLRGGAALVRSFAFPGPSPIVSYDTDGPARQWFAHLHPEEEIRNIVSLVGLPRI